MRALKILSDSAQKSIRFSLKRFWKQPLLVISVFIGLLIAVATVTTVPIYSDTTTFRVLEKELKTLEEGSLIPRQAFDFVYRYIGSWYGNIAYDKLKQLDHYFDDRLETSIGLPIGERINFISTDNLQLFPSDQPQTTSNLLDLVKLVSIDNIGDNITIIDGSMPETGNSEYVEVLVANDLANELGFNIGDEFILRLTDNGFGRPWTQKIKIKGIWIPKNPLDPYWSFYTSESFTKKLIINNSDLIMAISEIKLPINEAAWRLSLDGNGISSQNVERTLDRINIVQNQLNSIVMNTNLESSPVSALQAFSKTSKELTHILIFFALPILIVIILFLLMISDSFARAQKNEIAILRSRGASRRWIVGIYFWQWLSIGIAAAIGGLLLSLALTRMVANTYSFMVFAIHNKAYPTLTKSSFALAMTVVSFALCVMLIPIYKASKGTIVDYKRLAARNYDTKFWQKSYLDLFLLLMTAYGLYVLRSQGNLSLLGKSLGGNDPFTNPLMFLLPTFFILALLLVALRILPFIIENLNKLWNRFQGVSFLLVLRQFARSGRSHHASLLLVALTISISFFSSSMAATIDQGMHDNVYYQIGADVRFYEGGEFVQNDNKSFTGTKPTDQFAQDDNGYWNAIPITDYLSIPGVLGATRVGYYQGSTIINGTRINGNLIGVDRDSLEPICFYRSDFSSEPFPALLDRLASSLNAVLVNEKLWTQFNLDVGDVLDIQTSAINPIGNIKFKVAGIFRYFPGWNPGEDQNAFIVNPDYLFDTWGKIQPYDVLLRTSASASSKVISDSINNMGLTITSIHDSRSTLQGLFFSPKRQGALGLLSVGFISSTIIAILAVVVYVVFTFRERSIHLGVLRAIGLSTSQLRITMLMEIAMIGFTGIFLGNLAGYAASQLFIPVFPVVIEGGNAILPQITVINWTQIFWMNIVFLVVFIIIGLVYYNLSNKDKEFAAIKLGETT